MTRNSIYSLLGCALSVGAGAFLTLMLGATAPTTVTPMPVYNLSDKLGANENLNSMVFNDAFSRVGKLDNTGILDPFYLNGGSFAANGMIWPSRCGGRIICGGGRAPLNNLGSRGYQTGALTRYVYSGSPAGAAFVYLGYGLMFDGHIAFDGFPIPDNKTLLTMQNAQKTAVGLLILSVQIGGVPTGHLEMSANFAGFVHAIEIANSANTDNLSFPYLSFDVCDTCIYCDSDQSIRNRVLKMVTGHYVKQGLYVKRGGDWTIDSWEVDGPNTELIRLGDLAGSQQPGIHANIKIDNMASGFTLLVLEPHSSPQHVVINVSIDRASFNPATVVQGIDAGLPPGIHDEIYIHAVGNFDACARLNAMSTPGARP